MIDNPIQLTPKERRLLSDIIGIQLKSLRSITNNTARNLDVPLYCIQHSIQMEEFLANIDDATARFEELNEAPEYFLRLDDDEIEIIAFILNKAEIDLDYEGEKQSLLRKLIVREALKTQSPN